MGADAIQVATRFVTTEECDAPLEYKNAYLNAKKEDIVIVKSPVGMQEEPLRINLWKIVWLEIHQNQDVVINVLLHAIELLCRTVLRMHW